MNIPNNPYYQQATGAPAYSRPGFQMQPEYNRPGLQMQLPYQSPQMYQQPVMQDNTPQVRFVASREEAVASTVIPGMPCLMLNRADGEIYFKAIDAQTGVPIFEDYAKKQPEQMQAPQYATLDAVSAALQELEQRFDQKLSAVAAPRQAPRKAVNANDE